MQLTTAGLVHAALAAFAIAAGLVQSTRRKGGASHRMLGYVYVVAMLVADVSALTIRQFTGSFNVLHAGAAVNLGCVVAAMLPMLRRPRPPNWLEVHYRWMGAAYLGLIAAAATELVARLGPFTTKAQLWTATAVVTLLVMAVGTLLIGRYHPRKSTRASDVTARP